MHFMSYEQQVHYIPLFIHLKTHYSRVMGKGIYSFLFFFLEFGHLYEGVAWFTCHSTSRMSKISFLNKHQITFEIKMPDQFFKTPIGKLILVKVMNWIYEIAQGFKDVFVSLYKKTLSEKWIMLGRKHDWMTNSLFHWNFGKEV